MDSNELHSSGDDANNNVDRKYLGLKVAGAVALLAVGGLVGYQVSNGNVSFGKSEGDQILENIHEDLERQLAERGDPASGDPIQITAQNALQV